jgi:c-di-GMP-binding flagellar brake protein YcgR
MQKLPLEIGDIIFLQSLENRAAKAQSRILGARHGDFIIIENPVMHFSDRLFSKLSGNIHCQYTHEGDIYDFQSRVRTYIKEGFALIDYPNSFTQTQLRQHHRIRVNLETRLSLPRERDIISADMTDVSAGGCQLVVPSLLEVAKGTQCAMSFVLPDATQINKLTGTIRNVRLMKAERSTELGVEFAEPQEMLVKIQAFCRFCLFFEV